MQWNFSHLKFLFLSLRPCRKSKLTARKTMQHVFALSLSLSFSFSPIPFPLPPSVNRRFWVLKPEPRGKREREQRRPDCLSACLPVCSSYCVARRHSYRASDNNIRYSLKDTTKRPRFEHRTTNYYYELNRLFLISCFLLF
jgi:hypothetical protein